MRERWHALWTQSTSSLWTRPDVLALVGFTALALGLKAQYDLSGSFPSIESSIRWYGLAIGVMVIGWWGSYTDLSLLSTSATTGFRSARLRPGLAVRAVALNLLSLTLIFSSGPTLGVGVAAWFASIGLFVYSCRSRERTHAAEPEACAKRTTAPWTLPWNVEVVIFSAIMLVALVMRLWRLGDLGPGMHGDEGEAGAAALSILDGHPVSPFERGWSTQSNVYYWTIALCLRVFGTGLVGLRSFAVICGMITVAAVYLLAREFFGQRCAVIAGAFLAFQTADLIFSRQQFSNDTVPMFLACVAYLLARGLRTRGHVEFALAGFAAGFALYYYAGGRLVAPTALLFLGYFAVTRRQFGRLYWTHATAFLICLLLTSGPYILYNYAIAPIQGVGYPNDRFVWYHEAQLAAQYGVSGWPAILWNQLTQTLSILTYTHDASAMQATSFPIARPLESVLIVLGIAWALVRWKDGRFALLSIWFWASIVAGGVLTDEAPDLPRIVGILGVLPLLIAVVLDHLAGQVQSMVSTQSAFQALRRFSALAGASVAGSAIAVAGVGNWQTYTGEYMSAGGNQIVSLQAQYVHSKGPSYFYYDLGAYFPQLVTLYWGHGNNRFLNPTASGEDVSNLAEALPVVDNGSSGQQDVVFLVWTFSPQYTTLLYTLRRYYPHGTEAIDHELLLPGQAPLLVTYTVSHREIDAARGLRVRLTLSNGHSVSSVTHQADLNRLAGPKDAGYPLQAVWQGALVAPAGGRYVLRFSAPVGSSLQLDGRPIVALNGTSTDALTTQFLARGAHRLRLVATLSARKDHVGLRWSTPSSAPGAPTQPVTSRYLWVGKGVR